MVGDEGVGVKVKGSDVAGVVGIDIQGVGVVRTGVVGAEVVGFDIVGTGVVSAGAMPLIMCFYPQCLSATLRCENF